MIVQVLNIAIVNFISLLPKSGVRRMNCAELRCRMERTKIGDQFAANLKKIRETLGWSQAKLGELIGVPPGTIGNWEIGVFPTAPNLDKLSKVLGVPFKVLVGEDVAAFKQPAPPKPSSKEIRDYANELLKTGKLVLEIPVKHRKPKQ